MRSAWEGWCGGDAGRNAARTVGLIRKKEETVSKGNSVKFEADLDRSDAAAYVEALAQALRDGALTIESGSESLAVTVGASVRFEIEARNDDEKSKTSVEIEVTWNGQRSTAPSLEILGSEVDRHEDDDEAGEEEEEERVGSAPMIILPGQ
jgi:amphi-Trp domain-containing protein